MQEKILRDNGVPVQEGSGKRKSCTVRPPATCMEGASGIGILFCGCIILYICFVIFKFGKKRPVVSWRKHWLQIFSFTPHRLTNKVEDWTTLGIESASFFRTTRRHDCEDQGWGNDCGEEAGRLEGVMGNCHESGRLDLYFSILDAAMGGL